MPEIWYNTKKVSVTLNELVPRFWSTPNALSKLISRNRNNPYGVKPLQRGCRNRILLIDFDSLPKEIREALGDPRKIEHNLQNYYRTDADAVDFYSMFRRKDRSSLTHTEQNRYIINASVLIAIIKLRERRIMECIKVGMSINNMNSFLCDESNSFNTYLQRKKFPTHNLPTNPHRFRETLKAFENEFKYNGKMMPYNYLAIIKDVEGNKKLNSLKVDVRVITILNGLFSNMPHKPSKSEIFRAYESFLGGYAEVYNEVTGEIYAPKDFPKLSESTIKLWLSKWENRAATHKVRTNNRQLYMGLYKPFHQLERPKYAGSIISVDDRNPPFKDLSGKRVWFYNGIDLASECYTVFVHGKTKEGIIIEFYRQLVRNYTEWDINLPFELEAESALNSSFTNSFLQEGYLFQNVRIEANNARGKRIERYFGALRYEVEKKREGWLARPGAKSESNQAGSYEVPKLPYNDIISNAIEDIYTWNNMPHSQDPSKTRWEYFIEMQNPELRQTNWRAILPYLGFRTETSCNTGYVKLKGKYRAVAMQGNICLGESLIAVLKEIEGKDITVYWLDDNAGNLIKALAYYQNRFICELQEMPKYNRAKIERTEIDEKAREIQSAYVATVEGFIRKQQKGLAKIAILHNPKPKPTNGFHIPGMEGPKTFTISDKDPEIIEMPSDDFTPAKTKHVDWRTSFM